MPTENRHRQECPRCGGQTMRVRRLAEERLARVTMPMRRYRCTEAGCGWEDAIEIAPGTVQRRGLRERRRERAHQPRRLMAAFSVAAGLVFAMVGAQAWHFYRNSTSAVDRVASAQRVLPFGESHDGDPLPPGHPLLVPASSGPTGDLASEGTTPHVAALQPPGAAGGTEQRGEGAATVGAPALTDEAAPNPKPATSSATAAPEPGKAGTDDGPLQIRQDCAWGNPGRNPYRGTVEQALEGARLPPEIVARLAGMIRAGKATDRLEITTASIRTVHQYREYDPTSIAMTFGKTLCVNTRVNFKPGHLERADLYEVADASGATYSVMVPYVCGNVSVLADRAEQSDAMADAPVMVLGPDGRPVMRKATAPLPGVIGARIRTKTLVATTFAVPVPGTLANLLGGVALLGWFLRRRLRAREGE